MGELVVHLIRHANARREPDPSLSQQGIRDCVKLRKRFPRRRITDVFSSPLARCIETTSEVFRSYLQRKPMTILPDLVSVGDNAFSTSLGPLDLRLKFSYENMNYLYLGDNWNLSPEDAKEINERVTDVKKHLQSLKPRWREQTIEVVVVSHSSILSKLFAERVDWRSATWVECVFNDRSELVRRVP